ncbi:MAG: delta(1)-pyrroline-2-carboxylate reductase family protein [Bdellovibrionales bacterium]|nr:delta(1)-pyrroline-2-carboxylate reductase family protein [Ramlibacter sp.]
MNHLQPAMTSLLSPAETAAALPWRALVAGIARLLADKTAQVPARLVQPLPGGGSLFVMPALDSRVAITKLITFTPANAGTGRPAIQGDVVVFDTATGERRLVLDGPTVTARRTAAVSALAAQWLATDRAGPLLVVGAGVQGRAHMEAFAEVLGVREVHIASRSEASAQALARHARESGLTAHVTGDADAALAHCPLAVTCTPASQIVLGAFPREDGFVSAVGAFNPTMAELSPRLCRHFAELGSVVVDTADAVHEAGDLIQAGLQVTEFATLADVVCGRITAPQGQVLFKSCGWAGWDLAAARVALDSIGRAL